MKDAGVPVLNRDELPPVGEPQRTIQQMIHAGASPNEVNAFLKPYREQEQRRWKEIMEWQKQRDAE